MIAGKGIDPKDLTSSLTISILGLSWMSRSTESENSTRSTEREPPAGTEHSSAQRIISEPNFLSSSFSLPEGWSALAEPREFEHTSSDRCGPLWAGVMTPGLIS